MDTEPILVTCGRYNLTPAIDPSKRLDVGRALIPPSVVGSAGIFAALLAGESMYPRIRHGEYGIFRWETSLPSVGAIVLVELYELLGNSYILKKFSQDAMAGPFRCLSTAIFPLFTWTSTKMPESSLPSSPLFRR